MTIMIKKKTELHVKDMFIYLAHATNEKWELGVQNELFARNMYGDYMTGINEGVIRKL